MSRESWTLARDQEERGRAEAAMDAARARTATHLASVIADEWPGEKHQRLHAFLSTTAQSSEYNPLAHVRALAARLAPIATLSPPGDGGWHDPGTLTRADLDGLFAAGILAKAPRVEAGATYIEIASERALRGLK